MKIPLDPAVIGVIATGSFAAIVVFVTMCCMYNKCCRDVKYTISCSKDSSQPDSDLQNIMSVVIVANRTEEVKDKGSVATLTDSVLTGEGPPTYQMATEYSKVYAGKNCYCNE